MKITRPRIFTIVAITILFIGIYTVQTLGNHENADDRVDNYNYVLSTQTVGSKYKFTEESMLVETAKQIKAMGSNLLKFSMTPRYCTENYGLPENKHITSLTKLAQLEPSMKMVLDMDFKYYHIWVYGFSQYTPEPPGEKIDTNQVKFIGGYPEKYAEALYDELYDFTVHLLKEYNNSGKVFYLGNWEGDWHLRYDYDPLSTPEPKTLEGIKRWFEIRQKAIDDAKRDTPHENVKIYHYIEVNMVMIGLRDNRQCVTNTVVKDLNPDYVSYSAYDATNPFKTFESTATNLHDALDYIESHLKPKNGIPEGKRVWIGEYGNPASKYNEMMQDKRSKWTIKAGLEWGAPFILYWEMYNNEVDSKTGKQRGFWLIDNNGRKQKLWHTHHKFYIEARQYLKGYYKKNGHLPEIKKFQQEAINFNALKTK